MLLHSLCMYVNVDMLRYIYICHISIIEYVVYCVRSMAAIYFDQLLLTSLGLIDLIALQDRDQSVQEMEEQKLLATAGEEQYREQLAPGHGFRASVPKVIFKP